MRIVTNYTNAVLIKDSKDFLFGVFSGNVFDGAFVEVFADGIPVVFFEAFSEMNFTD